MRRGNVGQQTRPPRSFAFIIQVTLAAIVPAWLAVAGTDTLSVTSAAPNLASTQRTSHAPMVQNIGRDGRVSRRVRHEDIGSNWSGYLVKNGGYSAAQGTWTVPTATWVDYPPDPKGRQIYESTATWVGISDDKTLIQLGTQQTASLSSPVYYVWYELIPDFPVVIDATRFVVGPGDTIAASLRCTASCTPNAQQTWVLSMLNVNRWTTPFTVQVQYSSGLAIAEWVMEADCTYCGSSTDPTADNMAYLPNFSTFSFTGITVNNANPNLQPQDGLMLADPNGKAWSLVSAPAGGNSFTVSFARPGSP